MGARSGSMGVGLSTLACVLSSAIPVAAAPGSVSIQHDPARHAEAAARLASELGTEGYAVELRVEPEPTPCDPGAALPVSSDSVQKAWIRLTPGPDGDDVVVASICFLGSLPLLLKAAPSAPISEPRRLAVAAAEALNGLRSKVPGVAPVAEPPKPAPVAPPPARPVAPPPAVEQERPGASVAFGASLLATVPDLPPALGASLDAVLGVSASFGLALSGFVPVAGATVESPAVTAEVRSAWLRLGPRLSAPLGDVELSGALLVGPAVTWATAVARAPRRGAAAVSPGVIAGVGAALEYPRTGVLFARASASASVLVPGVRVELWSGEPRPRGTFPLGGAIGLGVRWGK